MKEIYICLVIITSVFYGNLTDAVELDRATILEQESAQHNWGIKSTLIAEPVNAFNERLGKPVANLRFFGEFLFSRENGVCGSDTSIPIDETTGLDQKLCTHADPFTYEVIDGIRVEDIDPSLLNVPLAEYPQIINHSGETSSLPQVKDVPWYELSNGSSVKGYTVGQWLDAKGRLTFKCSQSYNSYKFRAKNMIPGGLYSLFAIVFDTETSQLLDLPRPLGGTSANSFIADNHGRIDGERSLNACIPSIPENDRYQMVNIFVAYRTDGNLYGATAAQPRVAPFAGRGMTELPQLQFAIPENFKIKRFRHKK